MYLVKQAEPNHPHGFIHFQYDNIGDVMRCVKTLDSNEYAVFKTDGSGVYRPLPRWR